MNTTKPPAGPGLNAAPSTTLPVVAGFDGSDASKAALSWAAGEASRAGAPLHLVTVLQESEVRVPPYTAAAETFNLIDPAYGMLDALARVIDGEHPGLTISTDVLVDDPRQGLLTASAHASMVVVGARGIGAFKRMTLGSTSIELAGRSDVPVVVVPGSWTSADESTQSILVGVDIRHNLDAVLRFGFENAAELRVPLVALHVWDTHPSVVVTDADRERWGGQAELAITTALDGWRQKFPEVEALAAQRLAHPAQGLLDAAEHAELLVLGRRSQGRPHVGLGVGSVTRTVLHFATLPVAIVPSRV